MAKHRDHGGSRSLGAVKHRTLLYIRPDAAIITLRVNLGNALLSTATEAAQTPDTLLPTKMTSPLLRLLGALAGFGSAILFWFLGSTLAPPMRQHTLFDLDGSHYALMAFLLVPALTLAVVALFWVPPRVAGGGPLPEGRRWRIALVLIFVAAFVSGVAR